ncbi:MAG: peptidoglycan-binding domain-containing protein [Minisyncoccia bacterium]
MQLLRKMEKRLFKQLILTLVLGGIIFSFSYYFYLSSVPEPTCYDNKQNQKETGIDCGGPCLPCELKNQDNLTITENPKIFLKGNNKLDVLFKIKNLVSDWGARNFSYKIIISSKAGQQKEFIFEGFIWPHEIRTYLVQNLQTDFSPEAVKIEILKDSIEWAKPLKGIDLLSETPFILTNLQLNFSQAFSQEERNIYIFTKTLKKGMKDPEVFNLQKVLSLDPTVYPEGQVTGYFGELTEKAVMRFQKKYGIRVTGEVGPQTRAKLNELYGPSYLEPFSYTFKNVLKKGMSGIDVVNLQRALMIDSTAHPQGSISGYFDAVTEKALKEFQKKYGLPQTGIVDKETMAKLNELYSKEGAYSPEIIQLPIEVGEATLEVKGILFNQSIYNFKKGEIGIVLCNEKNQVIGFAKTNIENIYSNQRQNFNVKFYQQFPKNIAICEEVIGINILDIANVLK